MKRWLSLAAAGLMLAGCQLQPLYSGGSTGAVASTLSSVAVAPIEGQVGWLVYNKLKDRLTASGSSEARYRLNVELDDNIVGLGIRGDRGARRYRRIGRGHRRRQLRICDRGRRAERVGTPVRSRCGSDRCPTRAVRNADSRGAVRAPKGSIGRSVDEPDPKVRLYLFHGADESQSSALGDRLVAALKATSSCSS